MTRDTLDADIQLIEGDRTLLDEPLFPVVELASSLLAWLKDSTRCDFEFDSMSYDDVGTVAIRQSAGGWVFGSIFSPELSSTPVELSEAEQCVRTFVGQIESALRSLRIDPDYVLRD